MNSMEQDSRQCADSAKQSDRQCADSAKQSDRQCVDSAKQSDRQYAGSMNQNDRQCADSAKQSGGQCAGSTEQDMKKRARLRCMHLLEKRDYTEKQLRDKLRMGKTEYSPQIIEDALDYVKSYHYVDDGRYARRYVECMKEKKSRRQIEQELYQRGVAKEMIEDAFAQTDQVPEEDLISEWMRKRRFDSSTADIKEKQRMYAFLARKGFSGAAIARALREP